MINTHGSKVILADSDALIGMIFQTDALHRRCLKIAKFLKKNGYTIIILGPTVLEAATTLARDRAINRHDLSKKLLTDYSKMEMPGIPIEIYKDLAKNYKVDGTKKNTPFDYLVLSFAKKKKIEIIFSFDSFYKKQGLVLAEELC